MQRERFAFISCSKHNIEQTSEAEKILLLGAREIEERHASLQKQRRFSAKELLPLNYVTVGFASPSRPNSTFEAYFIRQREAASPP